MKRLSKKQEGVLILLCEGEIIHDYSDGSVSLTDADKNDYHLRKDTFSKLIDRAMIEVKALPNTTMARYGLTKQGEQYLLNYCQDEIKNFITE